jgi:hypothetical protein
MLYPFQSPDGSVVELEYAPDDAPEIGAIVLGADGVKYRRLASMPQIHGARDGSSNFPRFESNQLPRWWTHHKGEFSPEGKPRFENRKQINEAMARARHCGTEIEYDAL